MTQSNRLDHGERARHNLVDLYRYRHIMPTLREIINTQINEVISAVTGPVLAVSNAMVMQLNDIADAYAGGCPDRSTDVDMLDLDVHCVTLLNFLRRTRPSGYRHLVVQAQDWHNITPALLDQPLRLAEISAAISDQLGAPGQSCPLSVVTARAALLSTAIRPRPPDPGGEPQEDREEAFRQCPAS